MQELVDHLVLYQLVARIVIVIHRQSLDRRLVLSRFRLGHIGQHVSQQRSLIGWLEYVSASVLIPIEACRSLIQNFHLSLIPIQPLLHEGWHICLVIGFAAVYNRPLVDPFPNVYGCFPHRFVLFRLRNCLLWHYGITLLRICILDLLQVLLSYRIQILEEFIGSERETLIPNICVSSNSFPNLLAFILWQVTSYSIPKTIHCGLVHDR